MTGRIRQGSSETHRFQVDVMKRAKAMASMSSDSLAASSEADLPADLLKAGDKIQKLYLEMEKRMDVCL